MNDPQKNRIRFDYRDNQPLKELLSAVEVGESITVEMTLQAIRSDENEAEFVIKKVVGEEEDIVPTDDEPVMAVMRKTEGKKEPVESAY